MTWPLPAAKGNFNPDCATAVLLPAAGLPMIMYQGSSYKAAEPDSSPSLEVLIVLIASSSLWRTAWVSARSSALAWRVAFAKSPSMPCSRRLAARLARQRPIDQEASQASSNRPRIIPA